MKIRAIIVLAALIFHCQVEETIETSTKHAKEGRHFIGGIYSKPDHVLLGLNMSSLSSRGMIQCAQKCLPTHNCGSIKYHITQRRCELTKYGPQVLMKDFAFKQSSVFVLLQ